jgi:hypothetical protein
MLKIDFADLERQISDAEKVSKQFPAHSREVMIAILTADLVASILQSPHLGKVGLSPLQKPRTTAELFAEINPVQDTDKVLLAAYCIDSFGGGQEFTSDDLARCLKEAKIHPPSNVSLASLRSARKGNLSQKRKVGKKIFWSITQTGINAIEGLIQGPVAQSISSPKVVQGEGNEPEYSV